MQILSRGATAAQNDSRCSWEPSLSAWRCLGTKFAQLSFRSLDADNYTCSLTLLYLLGDDGVGDPMEMELYPYQVTL